jgi:hypothetical protein
MGVCEESQTRLGKHQVEEQPGSTQKTNLDSRSGSTVDYRSFLAALCPSWRHSGQANHRRRPGEGEYVLGQGRGINRLTELEKDTNCVRGTM